MESKVQNRAKALWTRSQQNVLTHWLSEVSGDNYCRALSASYTPGTVLSVFTGSPVTVT